MNANSKNNTPVSETSRLLNNRLMVRTPFEEVLEAFWPLSLAKAFESGNFKPSGRVQKRKEEQEEAP